MLSKISFLYILKVSVLININESNGIQTHNQFANERSTI